MPSVARNVDNVMTDRHTAIKIDLLSFGLSAFYTLGRNCKNLSVYSSPRESGNWKIFLGVRFSHFSPAFGTAEDGWSGKLSRYNKIEKRKTRLALWQPISRETQPRPLFVLMRIFDNIFFRLVRDTGIPGFFLERILFWFIVNELHCTYTRYLLAR